MHCLIHSAAHFARFTGALSRLDPHFTALLAALLTALRLVYHKFKMAPCCPAAHLVYCYRMLTRFTTRTTRRALYCACTCASPFFHHSWHVALLHIWYMSVVESLTLGTLTTCVRILLYMCPHTAVYVSSCRYVCVRMLLNMCPQTTIHVCSY
jgi:hypothetical protein